MRKGAAGGVLALAAALGIVLGCGSEPREEETDVPPAPVRIAEDGEEAETVLFFLTGDGWLRRESRPVPLPDEPGPRAAAAVELLLAGPRDEALFPPFAEGVSTGDVLVDEKGVVWLDLAAPEQPDPPASGSGLELARVYSVVNTVLANVEEARAVVLLWNGRQRPTLSGHVDTGHALLAAPGLVREPS